MKKPLVFALLLFCSGVVFSQDNNPPSSSSYTLEQAVNYAITNHSKMKNALLDEQAAKYKVNEIKGIGLPQINSSFDLRDMFEIPTSLIPGDFMGRPGTYTPIKFGLQYNTTAGFDASQLVFSSDYLVGLKAIKVYYELMQKSTTRTKIETSVAVQKAYYSVLVSEERLTLLNKNVERITKLKDDTKVLLDNGFVEQVDYDRITILHSNLMVEKTKVERLVQLGYSLLKYQMGLDQSSAVTLSDKLENIKFEIPQIDAMKFDYNSRVEFSLYELQKKSASLQLKKDRNSFLPTAALYAGYNAQLQRSVINFWDMGNKWYPAGFVGMKINMPVFAGFQKHNRIQQSKVNLMKAENDMTFIKNSIDLDREASRTTLVNSSGSLDAMKKNMDLAQQVYTVSKKKYDEGVGSNLEVLNAESSLKEAQTNYFGALYDALIAKIDFEKSNGNIK